MKQRVLLITLAVLCGGAWAWAGALAAPAGGYSGVTLSAGGVTGGALLLFGGIPALACGAWAVRAVGPLTGTFIVCAAMLGVALTGGSMGGWFWTNAAEQALPGAYLRLALEAVIWSAAAVLPLAWLTWRSRDRGRDRDDAEQHSESNESDSEMAAPAAAMPEPTAWLAMIVAATIGGVLTLLMLRSTDAAQAAGTLILAFAIAALVTQAFMASDNPLPVLLSPGLVAIAGYLYVAWIGPYGSTDATLEAWFGKLVADPSGQAALPGVALALPVAYASAGVLGCIVGLGIAKAFATARVAEAG